APPAVRHRRTGDRRGMPRRSARGRGARARGVRRALRELRPRLSAAGGGVVTLRRIARVAALLLVLAARSVAAEEASPAWQFDVMPYAWIPGTFGTIKVKGRTAAVDTTMGDVLTLLWHGDAFTAGGYFAARYDRWSGFLDAYGGFLNVHANETAPPRFCPVQAAATGRLRPVIMEFALGYELGHWSLPQRQRPVSLGVYLGMRYTHPGTELDVSGGVVNGQQANGNVSDNFNVADPMIGVRWEVPLLDRLSLDFRGDIGGLPTNSSLTWGLVGDVRYWVPYSLFSSQPWLEAGYRVVAYEHEFGGNSALNLQLRGVLLGVGFAF